jgi:2-polyprenyl-6-hydroxyphenyl methylase / 3-demethylubiquinone-9 3-methyltransferase
MCIILKKKLKKTKMGDFNFQANRSMEMADKIFNQRIADAIDIYEKYSKEFITRNCPICGDSRCVELDKFHNCYCIVRCDKCDSKFVNPIPPPHALNDYYLNYECNKFLANLTRGREKKFNIDDRVKTIASLIKKYEKKKIRILEVGCSSGSFLKGLKDYLNNECSETEFDFYGIDLDADAINKKVDDKLKLCCTSAERYTELANDLQLKFDFVLHYELIEHLVYPVDFMKAIKSLLTIGGFCVFTTPNAAGAENLASDYNTRRLIAHAIFPPMHLNAFSVQNIAYFSMRCGFDIIEIKTPGKLDVDMIVKNKMYINNSIFSSISDITCEDTLEKIQMLLAASFASSHMQVILRNH